MSEVSFVQTWYTPRVQSLGCGMITACDFSPRQLKSSRVGALGIFGTRTHRKPWVLWRGEKRLSCSVLLSGKQEEGRVAGWVRTHACAELRDKPGSPGGAEPGEKLIWRRGRRFLKAATLYVCRSVTGLGERWGLAGKVNYLNRKCPA